MTDRIALTKVCVTGPGKRPAELEFSNDLTVITGPSDTGKTYVVQLIDFMLGGKNPPKEIPESAGYDIARLGVAAVGQGRHFVLQRSLQGGDFLLFENPPGSGLRTDDDKGQRLGQRLSRSPSEGEPKDVSSFLLKLSGLENQLLRSNSKGETKRLSFRNLTNLICATETEIIEERSPIFSDIITNKTTEKSLFKLLLTGLDDSSIIAEPDDETATSNLRGQLQILTELLSKVDTAEVTEPTTTIDEKKRLLVSLDEEIDNCVELVSTGLDSINELETERKQLWTERRKLLSKRTSQAELLGKFELLQSHYSTDIKRLEAIQEASSYLDQYGILRCPLCGEPSCDRHITGQGALEHAQSLEDVWESSRAEIQKIAVLAEDLAATIIDTKTQLANLDVMLLKHDESLEELSARINKELEPATKSRSAELRKLQERKETLTQSIRREEHRSYLESKLSEIEKQLDAAEGSASFDFATGTTATSSAFSDEVLELLKAFKFPGAHKIEFSEKASDIVISGRARSSHGKGVRAIFHASFLVALMNYCIRRDLPHPGFIILDSPLVAYREPDVAVQEGLDSGVKDAFFLAMAQFRQGGQVIIFENELPPQDVGELDGVRIINFTKSKAGRYGFFPV